MSGSESQTADCETSDAAATGVDSDHTRSGSIGYAPDGAVGGPSDFIYDMKSSMKSDNETSLPNKDALQASRPETNDVTEKFEGNVTESNTTTDVTVSVASLPLEQDAIHMKGLGESFGMNPLPIDKDASYAEIPAIEDLEGKNMKDENRDSNLGHREAKQNQDSVSAAVEHESGKAQNEDMNTDQVESHGDNEITAPPYVHSSPLECEVQPSSPRLTSETQTQSYNKEDPIEIISHSTGAQVNAEEMAPTQMISDDGHSDSTKENIIPENLNSESAEDLGVATVTAGATASAPATVNNDSDSEPSVLLIDEDTQSPRPQSQPQPDKENMQTRRTGEIHGQDPPHIRTEMSIGNGGDNNASGLTDNSLGDCNNFPPNGDVVHSAAELNTHGDCDENGNGKSDDPGEAHFASISVAEQLRVRYMALKGESVIRLLGGKIVIMTIYLSTTFFNA